MGLRDDVTLIELPESMKKDPAARKGAIQEADYVFLCLPDAAAVEAVALIENENTRVVDASTAHRTAPGWVYGFPELLAGQRERVRHAKRVANPGCHATGFLSTAAPLVAIGVLPPDYPVACYSLTGYSGGGRKMIAEYEAADRAASLDAPNIYGLSLKHKHLPEMQKVAGLKVPPGLFPHSGGYLPGDGHLGAPAQPPATGKPHGGGPLRHALGLLRGAETD